jgi:hypothetical protein
MTGIGHGRQTMVGGHFGPPRRSARARTRSLIGALAVALGLMAVVASTAQAEEPTVSASFTCTSVTFTYTGFPNLPNNTVHEIITIDKVQVAYATFKFNGPTGSNTVTIHVPPGHHNVDARAKWETNGVKGGKDMPLKGGITCAPDPAFTLEKLQRIGSKTSYQTTPLPAGKVGQLVEYAIEAENTGNVPLKFSNFTDPKCDAGTITGGPGANPVGIGQETTYFCTHVLTAADGAAGFYTNTAEDTGESEEGTKITNESNTVIVELPTNPHNEVEFSCTSVTFVYTGFPNATNTVTEIVFVDGKEYLRKTFTFTGTSATDTVTLKLSPGHHSVDARTKWNTNGFKGGKDQPAKGGVTCTAEFTIVKKQEDSKHGSTTSPIPGELGEEVRYLIFVKNTGTMPLKFSNFTDEKCDSLVAGGPGESAVAPGETTIYACDVILDPADEEAGFYTNTAFDTGTPEGGAPITKESNTVVVEPIT